MTKFYVDATGAYLGGFDGAEPPTAAIEVSSAPAHASDTWQNGGWIANADAARDAFNAPILAELAEIDAKSIRPLREGETARVAELAEQAAALRAQLRK